MEFQILNTSFEPVYILENYESMLWVDRFAEPGSFELTAPISDDLLNFIKPDYYIINSESEHVMIIEDISIESSATEGGQIKAVGRSLESILDRRIIIQAQTNVSGGLQSGIKTLITNHIISPSDTNRTIPGFIFEDSTDTAITALTMDHQFTYDSLLDVVVGVCAEAHIGFKITLNNSNQFVFKLYAGDDRSYNSAGEFVIFSPEFDNLLSSTYIEKHSEFKNFALISGRGSGSSRVTETAGSGVGLARKEVYIDASNLEQGNLSATNYKKKLASKGKDELAKIQKESTYFDGECDTSKMYKYGVDFFLGDYVQLENEYGMGDKTRVIEFTWSHTTSGLETFPTFEKDEET